MATAIERLLQHEGVIHKIDPERLKSFKGELLDLFSASEKHRHLSIGDFAAAVLPPLHFDQFRIYRDSKMVPIAWVSWAWMTPEEGQGYIKGNFDFDIPVWIGGEQLWFIDFIAPYGHAAEIIRDIRDNVFPNQIAFAPDLDAEDGVPRVRKFIGAKVKGIDMDDDSSGFVDEL